MVGTIYTIPNCLTFFRIAAVVPMMGLVLVGTNWAMGAALVLFALAALSDFLDGWLARRLNQYSDLGRILDPIADKIIVGTMLPVLAARVEMPVISLIAIGLIMMREFMISGLREAMAGRNTPIMVSQLAKWKTTCQLLAVMGLLAGAIWPMLALAGHIILWIAALLTVITGIQYITPSVRAICASE